MTKSAVAEILAIDVPKLIQERVAKHFQTAVMAANRRT
jgi:hypothetical protein